MSGENARRWKKRDLTIAAVALIAILLIAYVLYNASMMGRMPWHSELEGSNFSFFTQGYGGEYYAIDSGGMRLISFNQDGSHRWDSSRGTTYTRRIAPSPDGTIYVTSYRLTDDNRILSAAIDQFGADGRLKQTIYQEEYQSEEMGAESNPDLPMYTSGFHGLTYHEGQLYFAQKHPTQIALYRINPLQNNPRLERLHVYPYPDAESRLLNLACDPVMEQVYFIDKLGGVWHAKEDGEHMAMPYPEPPAEPAFSIPYNLSWQDGMLYVTDIGTRMVYALEEQGYSILSDMGSDLPTKEYPMLYYQIAPAQDGGIALCSRYDLYIRSASGDLLEAPISFHYGTGTRTLTWLWWIAAALLALMVLAAIVALIIHLYRKMGREKLTSSVMLVAVVAVVTVLVMTQYSGSTNNRFANMTLDSLAGLSSLTASYIDGDALKQIDSLDDYDSPAYQKLRNTLKPVTGTNTADIKLINDTFTDSTAEWDAGIYRMLLRVIDGRVCYIYSSEDQWGALYPMDYPYEGTEFQMAYEQNTQVSFPNVLDYTGEYTYTITPIHDSTGQVVGVLEMGIDQRAFREETNALLREIALNVVVVVFVVMLLLSEIMFLGQVIGNRPTAKRRIALDVDAVRPLIFLVCFLDSLALIVSPFFAQSLYTEALGIPMELGVAMAYSVSFLFVGIAALVGGRAGERFGLFPIILAGTVLMLVGELLASASVTLWMFIIAKAVVGLGIGLSMNAADTFIAAQKDEAKVERGFSLSNVGLNAGTNCGIIIGTAIGAAWGYPSVYLASAAVGLLVVVYVLFLFSKKNLPDIRRKHTAEKHGMSLLKFLFSRRVFGYFVFLIFPYLVCNSFLYYFLPMVGDSIGLNEENISRIVFAYGIISIYVGPTVTNVLLTRFKGRGTVLIGGALLVIALLLFAWMPTLSIMIVSVAIFALADSFSFPAQNIYFTQLEETERFGSGAALGINNIVSGLAQTASSYVFAAAMIFGVQFGLGVIGVAVAACFVVFLFMSRGKGKSIDDPQRASVGGDGHSIDA